MHESEKWKWSCVRLRDPMDCSLPGSSIHGILQARVLKWAAIAFSSLFPELLIKSGYFETIWNKSLCLKVILLTDHCCAVCDYAFRNFTICSTRLLYLCCKLFLLYCHCFWELLWILRDFISEMHIIPKWILEFCMLWGDTETKEMIYSEILDSWESSN